MNVSVFFHVGLLVESLAAILAGIWTRVRVDKQVRAQSAGSLEGFATLFALKHKKKTLFFFHANFTWRQY